MCTSKNNTNIKNKIRDNIFVKNVKSYSKAAIFIGGSLTDSTFSNVKNCNPEGHDVFYRAGEEYTRNITFENVGK